MSTPILEPTSRRSSVASLSWRARGLAALALCVIVCSRVFAQDAAAPDETSDSDRLERLRTELSETLTNATLVGQFTVTGAKPEGAQAERYELSTVKHLGNDRWLFQVRIRYGEHDVTLPLTLPIRWAGDTPVITVDDLSVPGLGVY
ncbi:MAG: hypothetical protein KDA61_15350, partial [Planctomycetales bacterium]|nr:hypothetical protein [Planctomycetales bacterium]